MQLTCVVCAGTFHHGSPRMKRCRECISAGRGRCPCDAEVFVAPGASGLLLCDQCRAQGWRRYEQVKGNTYSAECNTCGQSFTVFASRQGRQRRCSACIRSGKRRCPVCKSVFEAEPVRSGSRPRCPDCLRAKQGPRGGKVVQWGEGKDRSERLTLVCRGVELYGKTRWARTCWHERTYTVSYAARMHTHRVQDGTYVCRPCIGLQRIYGDLVQQIADDPERFSQDVEFADRVIDLVGDRRIRSLRQAREMLALWGASHPPRPPRPSRADVATAASGPVSHEKPRLPRSWRISAGKWRKGVRWQLRQCQVCGLLLMLSPAQNQATVMHQRCMADGMRTPEVSAWLGERKRRREQGESAIRINRAMGTAMPIPRAKGRRADSETITRQFRWAILHLLGGDSLEAVGKQFEVSRQTVHGGIGHILQLLPGDDVEYAPFQNLVRNLREAAKKADIRTGVATGPSRRPAPQVAREPEMPNKVAGALEQGDVLLPPVARDAPDAVRVQATFPKEFFQG